MNNQDKGMNDSATFFSNMDDLQRSIDRFKFRAWAKAWGEWAMSEPFTLDELPLFPPHRATLGGEDTMGMVLMQSTGLKDKNGRLIFESDIVRCVNGHEGVVIWEEHDACFNVTDYYDSSDDYPTMAFMEGQLMEIIGDIHTTPHLLTGKVE